MTQMKIAIATPLFSLSPDAKRLSEVNKNIQSDASKFCSARRSAALRGAFSSLRSVFFLCDHKVAD
jgi:hypothetical protein